MLRQLRSQKLMRRVLRLTLILIIPSFVAFYGWSAMRGRGDTGRFYYARIKKGTVARWSEIQDYELRFARDRLQRQFINYAMLIGIPPAIFQREGIERIVPMKDIIYEAIKERLLVDYAEKHNLSVTNDEVRMHIKAMWPQDTALNFRRYLVQRRMNEAAFVAEKKYDLLLRKAEAHIMSQAKVSLFELWQEYLLSKEEIKIDYVEFLTKDYLDQVEVRQDGLEKFFNEHVEDYRIPDQIRYRYILISKEDLKSSVTVTQKEIKNYYESHKEDFKKPRLVKARHIFIEIKDPKDQESVTEAEEKIRDIYKQAKNEVTAFASLADLFTEDTSNEFIDTDGEKEKRGGEIGWVSPFYKSWGDAFTSATLELNAGEISEPVRSPRGFHIIKAEEVEKEGISPFEDVKDTILADLQNERVGEIFKAQGDSLKEEYYKYTTLKSLASAAGLPVRSTELVDAGTLYFPEIGSLDQHRELIEELDIGIMSEVLSTLISYVVLEPEKKVPSHLPSREEVRDEVVDDYEYAKAKEFALADAKSLEGAAQTFDDLKRTADEKDYQLKTTDYFTRLDMPSDLGEIYEFPRSTLNTPAGDITLSILGLDTERPKGYIVWHMKEKTSPSKDEFKEELPRLQRELLFTKRRAVLEEYLRDQIAQLKIDIQPSFLEQETP